MAKTKRFVKTYKQLLKDGPNDMSPVGSSVFDSQADVNTLIGIVMEYDPKNQHALIELIDALPEERIVQAGGLPVTYT